MTNEAIACDITALSREERDRHFDLAAQWRGAAQEVLELPDGYAFSFAPETETLMALAEFAGRERLCCPFLRFGIVVEANGGPLWLHLAGGKAVKAFVRENLVGG